MATEDIKVRLDLDKAKAERAAKAFGKAATAAFTGAAVAAAGLAAGIAKAVKLANVQIEAEKGYVAALKARGIATAGALEEIQKFNAAVQQSTSIGDENLLQVQKTLVSMGASQDNIRQLTLATIGLSKAQGIDLNASVKVVGKVLSQGATALSRYGIKAESSSEAIAKLSEFSKIAVEQTNTFAGQMKLLSANIGDALEVIGKAVLGTTDLADAARQANFFVLGLAQSLPRAVRAVQQWFLHLGQGLNLVSKLVVGFAEVLIFLGKPLEALLNIPGKLIESIMEASAPLRKFFEFLGERARDILGDENFEMMKSFFSVMGEGAKMVLNPMTAAGEGLKSVVGTIESGTEAVKNFASETIKSGKKIVDGLGSIDLPKVSIAEPESRQAKRERDEARRRQLANEGLAFDAHVAAREAEINKQRFGDASELVKELGQLKDKEKEKNDAIASLQIASAQMASDGIAGAISGSVDAMVQGSASLEQVLGSMIGGTIKQIGVMLIQMGTAGVLAGTLGTVIPAFAAITGGAIGVGAGLAAIAGGTAMVALGSALGGGGGGRGASAAGGGRGGGGAGGGRSSSRRRGFGLERDDIPGRFGDDGARETGDTVINVTFPAGFVTGTKREVANAVAKSAREALKLTPSGARRVR